MRDQNKIMREDEKFFVKYFEQKIQRNLFRKKKDRPTEDDMMDEDEDENEADVNDYADELFEKQLQDGDDEELDMDDDDMDMEGDENDLAFAEDEDDLDMDGDEDSGELPEGADEFEDDIDIGINLSCLYLNG